MRRRCTRPTERAATQGGEARGRGPSARGFGLLDLLITLSLAALLALAVLPQYDDALRDLRLDEASAELVSGIRYAAGLAVRYRRPFGFQTVGGAEGSFRVYDQRFAGNGAAQPAADPPVAAWGVVQHPLDKGWYSRRFAEIDPFRGATLTNATILFYPGGHSGSGDTTITVGLGGRQRTLTVAGPTGRVTVQ